MRVLLVAALVAATIAAAPEAASFALAEFRDDVRASAAYSVAKIQEKCASSSPPGWPTSFQRGYDCATCNPVSMQAAAPITAAPHLDSAESINKSVRVVYTILPGVVVYNPACIAASIDPVGDTFIDIVIQNLDVVSHTPADLVQGTAAVGHCFRRTVPPGRSMEILLKTTTDDQEIAAKGRARLAGEEWSRARDCGSLPEERAFVLFESTFEDNPVADLALSRLGTIHFKCVTHDFDANLVLSVGSLPLMIGRQL